MLREGIQREHQELKGALVEIRNLLKGPVPADRLMVSLAEVAKLVEIHFAHESRSHVFTKLPLELPQLASRIDRLKRDHGELRGELHEIATASSQLGWDGIAHRMLEWIDRLSSHEESEQTLLDLVEAQETPFGD